VPCHLLTVCRFNKLSLLAHTETLPCVHVANIFSSNYCFECAGAAAGKTTVYHCLDEFFRQEALSGITCSACSLESTLAATALLQTASRRRVPDNTAPSVERGNQSPEQHDVDTAEDTSGLVLSGFERDLRKHCLVGQRDAYIQDFDTSMEDAVDAAVQEVTTADDGTDSGSDCTTIEDEDGEQSHGGGELQEQAQERLGPSRSAPKGPTTAAGKDCTVDGEGSPTSSAQVDTLPPVDELRVPAMSLQLRQQDDRRAGQMREETADAGVGEEDDPVKSAASVLTALTGVSALTTPDASTSTDGRSSRKSDNPARQTRSGVTSTAPSRSGAGGPPQQPHQPSIPELQEMLLSLRRPVRTDAVKLSAISRLPQLLCIYLNRRVYDPSSGKMRKRMEHVSFPLVLNMQPYCRADGTSIVRKDGGLSSSGAGGKADSVGSSAKGSAGSLFPGLTRGAQAGGVLAGLVPGITGIPMFGQYALRAVVEHMGSAETGHYVAYCQVQDAAQDGTQKREWEYCSDERHHRVTETRVLQTQATMLFYERLPV
jgi:hypothetical protein